MGPKEKVVDRINSESHTGFLMYRASGRKARKILPEELTELAVNKRLL